MITVLKGLGVKALFISHCVLSFPPCGFSGAIFVPYVSSKSSNLRQAYLYQTAASIRP